jgi:DNA-binding NarL/FixJ family response regulator
MSIFVVDDHPLMREAVVMLLRRLRPGVQVIDLERLAQLQERTRKGDTPELICLDLRLPDTNGVSGVRETRAQFPHTPIVVLSASPASDYEDLAMEAGADLYLEKSAGATQISNALRSILMPDSETGTPSTEEKLSKRQNQLLAMIDQGLSNKEIAEQLSISEHTVKVHLWRLFRRLGATSRTQATFLARSRGLL